MINREEFYFDSRDEKTKIHAVKWLPEHGEITCILQIAHGMAEYIERYDEFACFLAERGILVVGSDHLGHGKSIHESSQQGYFAAKDSVTVLVRDLHRLKKRVQQDYPDKPYFILGHSMGSFLVRNYICMYGTGIRGAVLVGTGMQPKGMLVFGKGLCRFLSLFGGFKRKSALINSIVFGANNRRVKQPATPMDWLSRDEAIVNHYMTDNRCGFTFTLNGFYTLFQAIENLHDENFLSRMPKELPVLLLSGAEDPVGDYGKGVKRVCSQFARLGMKQVGMKLYDDDRHELLNETDRQQVYGDIYAWLLEHMY